MMRSVITIIILFIVQMGYSQIEYQEGYFVRNNGEKVNCLIWNKVWKNNPTTFKYRLSELSNDEIGTIEKVSEFGIEGEFKYVRKNVLVDRSSTDPDKLSLSPEPEFNKERHFLKVLVEGKKTLYSFVEGSFSRFFIGIEDKSVKQLIYKRYLAFAEVEVGEAAYRRYGRQLDSVQKEFINNYYRQQLWDNVRCEHTTLARVNSTSYGQRSLVKYFLENASCNGEELKNYAIKKKSDWFNLTPRVGYNQSALSIESSDFPFRNIDFGSQSSLRYGLEFEFIMPYNQGQWAIIIEPTIQTYKANGTSYIRSGPLNVLIEQEVSIDFNSFSLPIGVRYYYFLNERSKLFGNATFNGLLFDDINKDDYVEYELSNNLEIDERNYFAVGLGFKYANRVSAEIRYVFEHDILSNQQAYNGKYQIISAIIGITIL